MLKGYRTQITGILAVAIGIGGYLLGLMTLEIAGGYVLVGLAAVFGRAAVSEVKAILIEAITKGGSEK